MGEEQHGRRSGTVATDDSSRHPDVAHQGADGGVDANLAEKVARLEQLEREVLEARHAQLLHRDHVVGIEAEVGRQNAEILRLSGELRRQKGRADRLAARKKAQAKRIAVLVAKLETTRKRNAVLVRRVETMEAASARPSVARRVVRRLRGTRR